MNLDSIIRYAETIKMCGPKTTPLAKASAVTRGGILCFRIIRLRLKRGCK